VGPRLARIPFRPLLEKFTGRREILGALEHELTAGSARVIAQPIGVHADGGVGKTALAVEVGWRLFEAKKFEFVLFLNASTPETLHAELAALTATDALNLPLPEQSAKEQATRLTEVLHWLTAPENARRTLLILDNADSEEARQAVSKLLPKVVSCAVLITSRYGGNLSGVRKQELALFDAGEAREYLRGHLQPEFLSKADDEALDKIAGAVDHLPLALELVTSYLHETRQSPAEWLEEWRQSSVPMLTFHDADGVNYPVSLAQVWERSVERLSPKACALLHSLAWIAPRPSALPLEVVKIRDDWPDLRAALSELAKTSLIGWPATGEEISIHRVLQAVTRQGLSKEDRMASLNSAWARIEASLPDPEWNEAGWRLWERLAPHVRVLLDHVEGTPIEVAAASTMNRYGAWLYYRAQYTETEPLSERALTIVENAFGPEHPGIVQSLNNLAVIYRDQGRYAEAEPLFERAVAIQVKALGPEHPDVADSLNNLALLYYNTDRYHAAGRYTEAEPLFERALAIRVKALGPEHPDVAASLNDLAGLRRAQGRYTEAEALGGRALAIRVKALGSEHPDVADSLNNLAGLYRDQGCFEDAKPLYEWALAIWAKALGPEHPDVAASLNNLALLYRDQGRHSEAEALGAQALAILEKALGPEHRVVAACLENYSSLLRTVGRSQEAASLLARAQAIRAKWKLALGVIRAKHG
jgi:tetratricopeptide (TPR) repeat protein